MKNLFVFSSPRGDFIILTLVFLSLDIKGFFTLFAGQIYLALIIARKWHLYLPPILVLSASGENAFYSMAFFTILLK